MKQTLKMLKQDSGAALMMAIFTVTMMMIIATEIMYETNVELQVSGQMVNQVRAHYAAKAGLEISLLRLHIYRKVMSMLGDAGKGMPMLDMIWQMPFTWPPMVPESTSGVDKDEIKTAVKKSTMQGQYLSTIESESSKIDLSTLASDNKELAQNTQKQILDIFNDLMENDEEFAKRNSGTDFNKLVINLKDWVDADDKSDNGGDEASLYADVPVGDGKAKLPPNQPFKTFEELHMVAGMTDEFAKILIPKVTIFGAKAVNVKYASKEVMMAVLGLTAQQADQVVEERGKPDTQNFKDTQTFVQFLQGIGVNVDRYYDAEKNLVVPILIEPEFNFRVKSIGTAGKVQREITAIVYDYDRVLTELKKHAPKPSPTPQAGPTPVPAFEPTPTPKPSTATGTTTVPNERPNIVYWNES